MANGRFTADTIETLARRAALLCSNPDCAVLTVGPTVEDDGAANIGEAAHIYGITETSARYNPALSAVELADITNGIWLCRNCHKAADNDAVRFPADLLFEWRRRHEAAILARLGKAGDQVREKLDQDRLRPFVSTTNLARQIVLDRPKLWEYKLAVELLRSEFGPVIIRWQRLQRGMYVRKSILLDGEKVFEWIAAKNKDLQRIAAAVHPLLHALNDAFGPLGKPGDEKEILEVCRLIVSAAENLLEWEEDLRFTHVPELFEEALEAMQGIAGAFMQDIFGFEAALAKIVAMEKPDGNHTINITLKMPDGWSERVNTAAENLRQKYQ